MRRLNAARPSAASACRGAALLTVIMVMLVLGLLAAYLAESISGRYATTALAQLVRQAESAAASGLEWGRDRALQGGICAPAALQFSGMTIDVDCATAQVDEDGTVYAIYSITADARHGTYGNPDYVRRQARARYAAR